MKKNIIAKILSVVAVGYGMTSCLDGDQMNTPPGGSPNLVEMSYVQDGGTLINSGLNYFSAQALILGPADEADTIIFQVAVQGGNVDRDVTVTLQVDPNRALDNFSKDAIEYGIMPSDQYQFLSTTATIPKGKGFAEFKVVFFPPKVDFSKSVILPITATNDAGYVTSSNYGVLYLHLIGNPIAGVYDWEFKRYSTPTDPPTTSPDGASFAHATAVLSPQNPTTVTAHSGYYDKITDYIITFKGDTRGSLTDFRAILDPVHLAEVWDANGIVLATGPTITVNADQTIFTLHYTTGTRNCNDIYTLK
ncbi:MAG: DUF1735 domain-containing protein [Bacteroidota bacterium]